MWISFILFYSYLLCVCVSLACVWSFQKSFFSFQNMGPRNWGQIIRIDCRCLYLLSHLTSPGPVFYSALYLSVCVVCSFENTFLWWAIHWLSIISFLIKALTLLFVFVPCLSASGQSGTGWWTTCPTVEFWKLWVYCLGSDPCMCLFTAARGVLKAFLTLSGSWELLFMVLWSGTRLSVGLLGQTVIASASRAKWLENQGRKTKEIHFP